MSLLVAGTSGVEKQLSGLASGLINTAQQLGGSLGLAIITGQVAASTTRYLVNAHAQNSATVIAGTVHGYQVAFKIAAVFALIAGLIAIFLIKNVKPSENHEETTKMSAA